MRTKILLLLLPALFFAFTSFSQQTKIKWWNPAQNELNVIDGQAWSGETESDYDRLPLKAKSEVREAVWNLSKNSAGVKIRFRSNATEIKIRYKVKGNLNMPHMPTTGVSGVDLYAKNSDGDWQWCKGKYSFGDTITYNFTGITPDNKYGHNKGQEYHLYLPLYNSVAWMEVGVPEDALFEPLPTRKEKPIVVYGTSIAQGGCASRPGMAWTNILQRKMDRPLINLAFSGNGRLENEVVKLLTEIDAKIYILDCLPNLTQEKVYSSEEVKQRIRNSVKTLRKNSETPILLVEHAGYGDASSNNNTKANTDRLNKTMQKVFAQLKSNGIKNIYLLKQKELGLSFEDFVDGTHPTDLGMHKYAVAYEKKLRQILNEPIGKTVTTQPVTQAREPGVYNWEARHNQLLEMNKTNPPKICFFGNSITHYWAGEPKAPRVNGPESWNKYLGDIEVQNFGFGWDRVENVLWRIYHDELDGFSAEQVLFMLGTNNLHLNTDEEIVEGLALTIQAVKTRQPHAKILFIGIYPRRDYEERVAEINLKISQLAGIQNVDYIDIGGVLLQEDGKINETCFNDGLHPNEKGYSRLAPKIRAQLTK
ncbi:SGNH/GDSL hydrolase family protein [Prolixibacteraceae bacterium Z1-6]|uniref:SGNH/GDSL hydrolase family protein n=1 Tax=Draconibacterium aestuarii TaxID=2998507 RepID=A0A9X3FA70_9BACT|nr:SGNH/GDSL hydrolase family protein [Prolixibacteraceae bacterium Z1-6]